MTNVVLHGKRTVLRASAVFLAAALVLAGCNATSPSTSGRRSHPTPIATASLSPNSICSPDEGDNVDQSLNGDYTACFRVPNLRSSSLVVALQTFVEGLPRSSSSTSLTTTTRPAPNVSISLSSIVKRAMPGQNVVLEGHISHAVTPRPQYANLCWDGCGGLLEQGVPIRWLSSKKFEMTLLVPQTAWLVARNGAVRVHALSSGPYQVGVQCLTSVSGCALRGPEAKVSITLKAPKPRRCVPGRPCETLTLGPSIATVGDEVMVSGWAPLQDFIGRPFGYSLSVTAGSRHTPYPRLAFSSAKLAGSFNVVLTPTPLRVGQSPPWAHLGRIPYLSSTYSGPSAVDAAPNSSVVGWCEPSGIVVTGGSTPVNISTVGVRSALKGSTLHFFSGQSTATPQCDAVQLDPSHPDSVYAGFGAGEGSSIPPIFLAPVYTTNGGATWHTVPIPKGYSIEEFSGFTTEGNDVAALFSGNDGISTDGLPLSTNDGYVATELTANGGVNWSSTTLGCPSTGPCMTFGPYYWGNCNMSQDTQTLLLGPVGETSASGVKWRDSTWVTTVNSCFSQQLVASTSRDLLLIDPSSQYPLLRSTNLGLTWTNWELPSIPAANYGPDSVPITNSLVLAPDGSLFASITTPGGDRQDLYRLYPAATSWCQIPGVFGKTQPDSIQSLRVDATDLLWSQSSPFSVHSEPFSKLTC
jgi:hypothetical protein